MTLPADPKLAGLAAAAALFLLVAAWKTWRSGRLRRERDALAARLKELESAPRRHEYRLERFDVLWFPVVTYEPASGEVLQVVAGAPHCPACAKALKAPPGDGEWSCPGCGAKRPASVTDLAVSDSVAKQAREYFLQRPTPTLRNIKL